MGSILFRTGIFAEERFWGKVLDEWIVDTQEFARNKLPHLVGVLLIALLLAWLVRLVTARMVHIAEAHAASPQRVGQVKTLSSVLRATGLSTIGVVSGLLVLAAVGLNLEPLLASAGVVGIAIGLAAQNIVRDMFNGVLILIEDQFNVGDVITVAGVSGTVESMTLRKTSLRAANGTLCIVPNSQIGTVQNQSARNAVIAETVSVDYSANPDDVTKLLEKIALEVREEPEFRELFVADPQVLGVDQLKGSEMIFTVLFKTLATKQYGPLREFRRRVRLALEERKLLPGDPQRPFRSYEVGESD